MTPRKALPLVAAIAALAVIAAVLLSSGAGGEQVETGVVLAVDSAGLTDVRGFSLRTTDGRTLEFRVGRLENAVEFPPAHLGVHLADGSPIRVTYNQSGGDRVAFRLEDALASP